MGRTDRQGRRQHAGEGREIVLLVRPIRRRAWKRATPDAFIPAAGPEISFAGVHELCREVCHCVRRSCGEPVGTRGPRCRRCLRLHARLIVEWQPWCPKRRKNRRFRRPRCLVFVVPHQPNSTFWVHSGACRSAARGMMPASCDTGSPRLWAQPRPATAALRRRRCCETTQRPERASLAAWRGRSGARSSPAPAPPRSPSAGVVPGGVIRAPRETPPAAVAMVPWLEQPVFIARGMETAVADQSLKTAEM